MNVDLALQALEAARQLLEPGVQRRGMRASRVGQDPYQLVDMRRPLRTMMPNSAISPRSG